MVYVQLIKWKNNTNGFITENMTLTVFIIRDVPECGSCDQKTNLGSCDQNLFSVSLDLQHLTTTNPHPLSLSSALWSAGWTLSITKPVIQSIWKKKKFRNKMVRN
jgi:hypothetical protein